VTSNAQPRRLLGAILAGFASVAGIYTAACGEPSHVYLGRLYRVDRDCVATVSSVDVVDGEEPGTCEPVCLVQTTFDAERVIYVSTMCGPYPFGFDATGDHPECPAALAAFARNDTCLADGGTTNPPEDAGPEDDGGEDG
jgi:hypothetical protein